MRMPSLAAMSLVLGIIVASSASAGVIYDPGTLAFQSNNQSMWGSGGSFTKSQSVFVGAQWTNKTATIGGIAGSANQVVIPASGAVYVPVYEPKVWVPTPSWQHPFAGYYTGCGCNKSVKISNGTNAVTADTRTGVKLDVNSSGKVGLNFGYDINSGSVDTKANFGATATLPDTVQASQFFNITTNSNFANGKVITQSPQLDAYVNSVVQLSGSINAEACALTLGCASGSTALPNINVNQSIVSIDPGGVKILNGVGADGGPLISAPILNQAMTLEGSLTYVPPAEPEPGFKLTGPGGITIASTEPPTPSITEDLASLSLNIPNVATTGTGSGTSVSSSGSDNLMSLMLDLNGAATIFGGAPPTGFGFDLIDSSAIKLGGKIYLLDAQAGPKLSVSQNFKFTPTLMTTINFNHPVDVAGQGFVNSWTGKWSDLPQFAITQDTTFTPKFWLDALLQNQTGLNLGLTGTLDLLKLQATANILGVDLLNLTPFTLNNLLGISNELFSTPTVGFNVFDNSFDLGGFNMITGPSFAMNLEGNPTVPGSSYGGGSGSGGPTNNGGTPVPEPGTLWLFAAGLLLLLPQARRRPRRGA